MSAVRGALSLLILLLWTAPSRALESSDLDDRAALSLPPILREVDIEERLGQRLSGDLVFADQEGRRVPLSSLFPGDEPVLLVLAYYRCPMLCGLVLNGLVRGLREVSLRLGEQYRAVTVSFDPKDGPDAAARKRSAALEALGTPGAPDWPFLVGAESQGRALADGLGFRFAFDPRTEQYAHPSVVFVLTPDGRISRYLYGVDFAPRDLRLALVEAGEGRIGTIANRVILSCYRYNPARRRYGPYVFGFLRAGAAAIFAVVAAVVITLWRRESRSPRTGRRTP